MPKKELIVVAGPNGAGKSTYANEFVGQHPCTYLSADAIAAELAPHDPASKQFEAGREFLTRVRRQLVLEESFIVETTLSGRSFRNVLHDAKSAGFVTSIIFVYLDSADTCVARVQERVRKGGHNVPESDIRRRFSRSFANFWHVYRGIADLWYVIYNSSNQYMDVAFGRKDAISVWDEALFNSFHRLIGLEQHGQSDV